jgi:hypothetical protein
MRLALSAANRLVPAMTSAYCCPYEGLCLSYSRWMAVMKSWAVTSRLTGGA